MFLYYLNYILNSVYLNKFILDYIIKLFYHQIFMSEKLVIFQKSTYYIFIIVNVV